MPAVRLFVCSALIIYFGLACRGYTFDSVTIGNPERHVRKASHHGSKQH